MNDVFNANAFGLVDMTLAINKAPYKPARIGQMGLFRDQPVSTTTVALEEIAGTIRLLPTKERGAPASLAVNPKRTVRALKVPHIPHNDVIRAEEIQGVRAFGSDSAPQTQTIVTNDKLLRMRQNHEVTHEYHRIGAVKGIVYDSDGTTVLYNLFTEFGVAQPTQAMVLGTAGTDVRKNCLAAKRTIEAALGAAMYDHIHAFCGQLFFDKLISHADVKAAYDRYQDGAALRGDVRKGFEFAGIVFEEYVGSVGGVDFITTGECQFFPVGVPDLFVQHWAPADFLETANTLGQPIYAKGEAMPFNRGVNLHTQSNPLMICSRPGVLVKGTTN